MMEFNSKPNHILFDCLHREPLIIKKKLYLRGPRFVFNLRNYFPSCNIRPVRIWLRSAFRSFCAPVRNGKITVSRLIFNSSNTRPQNGGGSNKRTYRDYVTLRFLNFFSESGYFDRSLM